MSPKKLSNLALILAVISILGIMAMLLFRPAWGLATWWPLAGLGLSFLLVVIALIKGVSMDARRRVDLVDVMNDCNAGIPYPENRTEA
jgi:hypothetical protein